MGKSVIVFLTVCWLSLTATAFAFEPLFCARIDYWTGAGPLSVFAGDFDGDGTLDLAVANTFSHDVSILINLSQLVIPPCEYSPGDVNHNGVSLKLADVVAEIGAYRGSSEASGCPECPGTGR